MMLRGVFCRNKKAEKFKLSSLRNLTLSTRALLINIYIYIKKITSAILPNWNHIELMFKWQISPLHICLRLHSQLFQVKYKAGQPATWSILQNSPWAETILGIFHYQIYNSSSQFLSSTSACHKSANVKLSTNTLFFPSPEINSVKISPKSNPVNKIPHKYTSPFKSISCYFLIKSEILY